MTDSEIEHQSACRLLPCLPRRVLTSFRCFRYNIYDKALFKGGAAAETLYRPTQRKDDDWDDEDKVQHVPIHPANLPLSHTVL